MEIFGYDPRRAFYIGLRLESQTHLIEVGRVAPLQHKANFRMRDEIAVSCYSISVTFGSDS
jgi:hypothetical protein